MGIATRVGEWTRRFRQEEELASLGPEGRALVARDLGLAEQELAALPASPEGAGLRLSAMLETLELDEARLGRERRAVLKDLELTCSRCGETRACESHLRAGDAAATYERFCPNALTLDALVADGSALAPETGPR